jgi:nucleotide-binding universal stress UspA family protein
MLNILVAVDGSENALQAVRHAVKLASANSDIRLHLLNVQPSLPSAATSFVHADTVRSFHKEEGEKALKSAQELLKSAGVSYECHIAVGNQAEAIVEYAREKNCDQILMGTRGLGGLSNLLLGSVATRVLHLTDVPVTLIPLKGSR